MDTHHAVVGQLGDSRRLWRINLALFLAGFATFSLLYSVQPLLPLFAREFGIGAAESSLALSLTTGFLAIAILFAGALSEGRNRKLLMFVSMALAAVCNLAGALFNDWYGLLLARALAGISFGGVPAVALTYLAEEVDPRRLGLSVGLYVSGTAFGGMVGRIGTGFAADTWSWHWALGGLSVIDLLVAVAFLALLPASRHAVRAQRINLAEHAKIWRRHLVHPRLQTLFLIAALSTGVFVTVYNYAGFRLMATPFGLSAAQTSLIFCVYVFGMAASSIGGWLADRFGPAPVLLTGTLTSTAGVLLSLMSNLLGAIGGIVLLTIGFFMAHAVASGWLGRLAGVHKGHAASLYLLAYYMGSSILGSSGGWFWQQGGWRAVCAFALLALALIVALALRLRAAATFSEPCSAAPASSI